MGNCAGCTGPAPLRGNRQELVRQPQNQYSPQHPLKYSSKPFSSSMYRQSPPYNQTSDGKLMRESLSPSYPLQDPWKSRIASRKIKDYRREPTLREQQQLKNPLTSTAVMEQSPVLMIQQKQKSIRSDSLQQSIINRYNYNTQIQSPTLDALMLRSSSNGNSYSMSKSGDKDKYNREKERDRDIGRSGRWKQQSATLHQIQQNSMERMVTSGNVTPLNRRLNMTNSQNQKNNYNISHDHYSQSSSSRTYDKYLPKKIDNYRDRKLAQIMELVQQDAQTPAYVKSLRKQQGEDIKMNNFGKFDAVGPFQWFSLGKYLGQITSDDQDDERQYNNKSKSKMSQSSSKIRNNPELTQKKAELKMIPQQVGQSKYTVKAA